MAVERRKVKIDPKKHYLGLDNLLNKDFPERGYDWSKFCQDNSFPPVVYHGTNSYLEEQILSQGLVPGLNCGLNVEKDLDELINCLEMSSLPESLVKCWSKDFKVCRYDVKTLSFALAPFLAARYARRSPECLHDLQLYLNSVKNIFCKENIAKDHPSFQWIEQKILECASFDKKLASFSPILIGVQTSLDYFDVRKPYYLKSREGFQFTQRFVGYSETRLKCHARGYHRDESLRRDFEPAGNELITSQRIPPQDIVSIIYLEEDAKTEIEKQINPPT